MNAFPMRGSDTSRAIVMTLIGSALLSLNDALLKFLVDVLPTGEIMFVRGILMMIPIGILAWRARGTAALRIQDLKRQIGRGVALALSTYTFIFALKFMPLADAEAVLFSTPLIVAVLARPMLGEQVTPARLIAVIGGLIGVVLILQPGGALGWFIVVPAFSAVALAFSEIWTRRLSGTDGGIAILAFTTALVGLSGVLSLPWGWEPIGWRELGLMTACAVLMGGAHFLFIEAMRLAEASVVVPFKYSVMLWAVAFGFLFWRELPVAAVAAGGALVIACGLFLWQSEIRRRRRAAPN